MRGHPASLAKLATLQEEPTHWQVPGPASGENRVNALGVSTLVTDYVPRSHRQWRGQWPEGPPIAIETSQEPIKNRATTALPTNGLHTQAKDGGLGATTSDEGHEQGCSRDARARKGYSWVI